MKKYQNDIWNRVYTKQMLAIIITINYQFYIYIVNLGLREAT